MLITSPLSKSVMLNSMYPSVQNGLIEALVHLVLVVCTLFPPLPCPPVSIPHKSLKRLLHSLTFHRITRPNRLSDFLLLLQYDIFIIILEALSFLKLLFDHFSLFSQFLGFFSLQRSVPYRKVVRVEFVLMSYDALSELFC